MILTMLKTTFQQKEPKCLIYGDLSLKISKVIFKKTYRTARAHMMHLTTISPLALINMLQKKKKVLQEKEKRHMNKNLRLAIMQRSKLKNKANKTKNPLVKKLNKTANLEYFNI